MILLVTAALIVIAGVWLAGRGNSQAGGIGTPLYVTRTPLIDRLNTQAANMRRAAANRCLPRPFLRWHPGHLVPAARRKSAISWRAGELARLRARASVCDRVPWWPWGALANCESGGRWAYNGPSGFDGGLQFLPSTWSTARRLVGVNYAYAYQAPAVVQVRVARAWLARTSWAQWPACSSKLGLR